MHKVIRNDAPNELIIKDKEWKEQLRLNPTLKPDWEAFSKTVLRKQTISKLEDMYGGCCCYCESKIKNTSYPEIEHFKPKSDFPELCFDYDNLHFSCKRCNLAKWKNYSIKMFNPSDDNPETFINYIGEIAISIDKDERGTEMIDILKLNDRTDLKEERSKYLNPFVRQYELIVEALEVIGNSADQNISVIKPFIDNFISLVDINSHHGESYCSMIKHNFSDKVEMLKEVL